MNDNNSTPKRFIGLDSHKKYLIAIGLDENLNQVYGPKRVQLRYVDYWIKNTLKENDEVAIEMTTNTWQLYDEINPHVERVVVAHPPHVTLITGAKVMTDKKAAFRLAKLLAKDMLESVWVPPEEVREQRALIAQRNKLCRLSTQAKNRLHSLLQRKHISPPEGNPFHEENYEWWLNLDVSYVEKLNLKCNLSMLKFAQEQISEYNAALNLLAAKDPRAMRLIHLPGIAVVNAMTILSAIGDIHRFPSPENLVGYAGLGASIHDSGQTTRTGKITKQGRRELRTALVEAAQSAVDRHPYWENELKKKEPLKGRNKVVVAVARKLLVTIWYVLARDQTDRYVQPDMVARKYFRIAYEIGMKNIPGDQTAPEFVRSRLDDLGIGANVNYIPRGSKRKPVRLPPSSLITS